MSTLTLYDPPDVDEAHADWKANCGPCALAAVLGRPVMSLREFFPAYPRRPWCNPTGMKAAIEAAGVEWASAGKGRPRETGLVFLQLDGPWCQPGVPVAAAYRHTHWVGVSGGMVYDVNGGWLSRADWEAEVMALILEHTPGSTGFWVRAGIEVLASVGIGT